MFDDPANALEEIEPKDKTRKEVLSARVDLYMTAKKWDMAAAVATHLVKVEPEDAGDGVQNRSRNQITEIFCQQMVRFLLLIA